MTRAFAIPRFNRLRIDFAVFWLGILFLLFVSLVQMNRGVSDQIDILATANSDSTQWALAQSEVEFLALSMAISDARADPALPMSYLRERFDIFYSRARTLADSPLLKKLRDDPAVIEGLQNISTYLEDMVPLIDGDDATLRSSLDQLAARTSTLRADIRKINLSGVNLFSRDSDFQRQETVRVLSEASRAAFALFIMLLLTAALLVQFYSRARRRAREQSQMRSRLGAMVSSSLDAVIAVDSTGTVIEYNGSAERIFGHSRAEAIGQSISDLIVPDHLKEAHHAGMARYLRTGERHVVGKGRVQMEARRKNGEHFPVELSIEAAEDDRGEIFISFIRDNSHRLSAEKALISARDRAVAGEKAKSDLIAVMSHEMRTPLNGMLGTLELIDQSTLSNKHREYIEIIRASGQMLLHHVNDVLEISRVDAGKVEFDAQPFSLFSLLKELVDSQRGVAEHRANTLSIKLDMQGADRVIGDAIRIRQVLLNLIGNAIKFTRHGAITVTATRLEGDNLEFRVTDSGIGIPAKDIDRVFEEFVTLDPSFSREVGGAGLGLAIVKRLVSAMGGVVGVESEIGFGSSFWVRLPLPMSDLESEQPDAAEVAAQGAAKGIPVPPMNILIVEDNRFNRVVARDLLELDGHSVDEAFNGYEGYAAVQAKKYDLVLMDISMPVLDGVKATRKIRAAETGETHLPIIALTANAIPAERDRFLSAGLDDILVKPITLRALRDVLRRNTGSDNAETLEHEAAAQPASALDHERLRDLEDALGEAKVKGFIEDFLKEAVVELGDIIKTLRQGAADDDFAHEAHQLAGSAGLVGAEDLRAALIDIEDRVEAGEAVGPEVGPLLESIWRRTETELRAHLKGARA